MDVHPPHTAIHGWRDFFIHIATIVVGLLIAIGLEQTVEWVHHVHQIREIRHDLREERDLNVASFHYNLHYLRHERAMYENDLRIFQYLQQHPGTPADKLPGIPSWGAAIALTSRTAWDSPQYTEALALMPKTEVETYRRTYDQLQKFDTLYETFTTAVNKADAYEFLTTNLSKLTPAQIDAQIPLIQDCLSLIYSLTVQLNNIARLFPEFAPGPADDELQSFHKDPDPSALPTARAFTLRDAATADALDAAQDTLTDFNRELNLRGPIHASEIYAETLKTHPNFKPDEHQLNRRGYALIYDGDLDAAIEVLKLNTTLYPNSWNAFDSLAEAYAKDDNKPLALQNYETSLKLNPANTNATQHLKELNSQ